MAARAMDLASRLKIRRRARSGAGSRPGGRLRAIWLVWLLAPLLAAGCGRRPKTSPPASGPVTAYEEGIASWYGHPYHGRRTANGEVYDMNRLTAAHRTLPFDTWVEVQNLDNGRRSTVRINDRGPFVGGRIIDLSRKSAEQLDMIGPGTAPVRISIIDAPPPTGRELYGVQVGAFREEKNARALRDRLQPTFQDVFIQRAGDFHRVRVGRVGSTSQASVLAQRLRQVVGVADAVVVRLD